MATVRVLLKNKVLVMRNLYAIYVLCVLLLSGCTAPLDPQRRSIALSASTAYISVDNGVKNKAGEGSVIAVPYEGTPSANNPLNVTLWLSYTCGSYSHVPQMPQYLPCVTTMEYSTSTPEDVRTSAGSIITYPIETDINYSAVGDEVYCVGFYPAEGWGNPTDAGEKTSASHIIDGSHDLMFADQMVGTYSDNFANQRFKHLLTWLKINLSAASHKAAEIWGSVESLEIVSPSTNVGITFATSVGGESTISYDDTSAELSLDLIPDDKALSLTVKAFSQVFCAPPAKAIKKSDGHFEYVPATYTGSDVKGFGYIMRVKTQNVNEKEVFVELKDDDNVSISESDDAVGKLYVITLHFHDIEVVEGVCTLKQWEDQNSDFYLSPM